MHGELLIRRTIAFTVGSITQAIRYQYWLQQSEKHFTGLQPNIPKDRQPLLYVLINLPQRVLNDPAASELSSRLSRYSSRPATAEMLQIGNAKLGVYKRCA